MECSALHGRLVGPQPRRHRIPNHGRRVLEHAANARVRKTGIPQPQVVRFHGIGHHAGIKLAKRIQFRLGEQWCNCHQFLPFRIGFRTSAHTLTCTSLRATLSLSAISRNPENAPTAYFSHRTAKRRHCRLEPPPATSPDTRSASQGLLVQPLAAASWLYSSSAVGGFAPELHACVRRWSCPVTNIPVNNSASQH